MFRLKNQTKVLLASALGMGVFQLATGWQYPTIAIQRALFSSGLIAVVAVIVQTRTQK